MNKVNIFWFRRDLRLIDNHGLFRALRSGLQVLPVFIFDDNILEKLEDRADARVNFIYNEVQHLKKILEQNGSTMLVITGKPVDVFRQLISEYEIHAVFTNRDYEPYALQRDQNVNSFLAKNGIEFQTFKDQVIFDKGDVIKDDGNPYTVFTPYSRKWKDRFDQQGPEHYPSEKFQDQFFKTLPFEMPFLEKTGFHPGPFPYPSREINERLIENYHKTRDYPFLEGTTRLGLHLRFGTISIRKLAELANRLNKAFLKELIWREFYMMILWHFPHVVSGAFKPVYDRIRWRNDETLFRAWCKGMTGYPIVDAGMRQLNATGYMHNRLRMITASFLVKHLLINWQWGEAYFASKLLDFELSSNNGGWQWAAGTGCDAAPYFRVFNPDLQARKFDPHLKYIRKWVPEYGKTDYPERIVDHAEARNLAISVYKKALMEQNEP